MTLKDFLSEVFGQKEKRYKTREADNDSQESADDRDWLDELMMLDEIFDDD